jgi:protein gp37
VTPARKTGWTEESWNPTTGCAKISPGCAHCWAERMARRLQGIGQARYARGFAVITHEDLLEKPLHWVKPRHVYVSFMGDLFHDEVPDEFIARVFDVMVRSPQHRFHLLTKRPGARPLQAEWVRSVRDQCIAAGVPFYFKQWGGVRRKETGRELDGRLWSEHPREAGQLAFEDLGTTG